MQNRYSTPKRLVPDSTNRFRGTEYHERNNRNRDKLRSILQIQNERIQETQKTRKKREFTEDQKKSPQKNERVLEKTKENQLMEE